MLFIKIHGVKEIPIGVGTFLIRCPSCETHNWADVMVVSKYLHYYFVPMWPVAKEANVICHQCGLKRYGLVFGPRLIENFEEIKSDYKHPLFSYFGLVLLVVLIIGILLTQVIKFK